MTEERGSYGSGKTHDNVKYFGICIDCINQAGVSFSPLSSTVPHKLDMVEAFHTHMPQVYKCKDEVVHFCQPLKQKEFCPSNRIWIGFVRVYISVIGSRLS